MHSFVKGLFAFLMYRYLMNNAPALTWTNGVVANQCEKLHDTSVESLVFYTYTLKNTIQLLGVFGGIFPPMLLSYIATTRYLETTSGVKADQGPCSAFEVVQS